MSALPFSFPAAENCGGTYMLLSIERQTGTYKTEFALYVPVFLSVITYITDFLVYFNFIILDQKAKYLHVTGDNKKNVIKNLML